MPVNMFVYLRCSVRNSALIYIRLSGDRTSMPGIISLLHGLFMG